MTVPYSRKAARSPIKRGQADGSITSRESPEVIVIYLMTALTGMNSMVKTGTPMCRSMALLPGLFATYVAGCQQLRSDSGLSPVEQEVVFLAISRSNRCTYCMAAHSFVADAMSKVPPAVTDAIRDGSRSPTLAWRAWRHSPR